MRVGSLLTEPRIGCADSFGGSHYSIIYRMGKTFSESWHRVAGLKAQLRPQVRVRRQYFRGERWYLLHDPYNNQFFRVRPAAYAFLLRLGPKRNVESAWKAVLEERPEDAPGQQDVVELMSQLYASNLLFADVPADTAALFKRYKKRRKREVTAKILGAMFARFPLFNPDDLLERIKPFSNTVFSRWGFLIWLAVVVWGVSAVIASSNEFVAQSRRVLDPSNLPWLFLVTAVMKTFHEYGHMALCKKYGGSVKRAGILLMIFTPMPFADTTSAWNFRERSKRLAVGFGGMIVEVFLASIAGIIWAKTGEGLTSDLAFNAMLVGSISTVLFNLNPLLRFDGYFILSDLSGIPNLYQRSLKFLRYLAERYLFGLRREISPAEDKTEAWVFGFYGVFGAIYRFVLFGSILIFVWDRFLLLGVIMGSVCLVAWVVVPMGKLVKYLVSGPKLHLRRSRAISSVLGIAAFLCLLVRFLPFPHSIRAAGSLEAQQTSALTVGAGGRVVTLLATPGSEVAAGQPLVRLEDPELEISGREIEAQLTETRTRIRKAMAEDPASQPVLQGYLDALEKRADELEKRRTSLLVLAPHKGWWVAPDLEESIGAWIPRGASIGEIVDPEVFEFRVQVPVNRVPQIVSAVESPARVRLDGQPWTRLEVTSRVLVAAAPESVEKRGQESESENAKQPSFEFRGVIEPSDDAALLHGLAGQIRFSLPSQSLWLQGKRLWREFIEKRSRA